MKKKLLTQISHAFGSRLGRLFGEQTAAPRRTRADLRLRALEPRVLLDAAAAATAAEAMADASRQAEAAHEGAQDATHEALLSALAVGETSAQAQLSLVFIDSSVQDAQALIDAIGNTAEVHLIDAGEDGVQAIADAVAGRRGIDSIHIISHGSAGALQLGTAALDAQSMGGEYATLLQGLRGSLAPEADILVYGCDFGGGPAGEQAAQLLATLTGADVAASTDPTGAAALGGDWDLELQAGVIEAAAVSAPAWNHLLTAPSLSTAPNLALTVGEDAGLPVGAVGAPVSDFTVGITDADAGAVKGIAITTTVETNGSWYYTTDGGASWSAVGTVSATNALLLADNASTRLYFAPAADFSGSAGNALTLKAWDQTAGTAGTKANPASTAVSTASDTIAVTVTAVNDAPVLLDTVRTLTGINEDAAAPSGTAVGTAITLPALHINDLFVMDADASALKGVAVVGADESHGTWFYSINNGTTWTALGAVSEANALLLSNAGTSKLYFQPAADYNGTATLSLRAWDQTSGTNGGRANAGVNGGSSAFSAALGSASITIAPVADIVDDVVSTAEDTAKTFNPITGSGETSGADSFESSARLITAVGGYAISPGGNAVPVSHGSVSLAADGSTLTFTPDADYNGTASFSYTVTSGGVTETADITLTITAVADAPRIDLDGNNTSRDYAGRYDQDPVALGRAIAITDPEGDNLASLTVTLSGATAADSLYLSAAVAGISSSYNAGTGVLTLSGNATLASYQTALQNVRFSTTADTTTARQLTVAAVSAAAPTASNVVTATITPIDSDGDGVNNAHDIDDDNDGILDISEGLDRNSIGPELLSNPGFASLSGWTSNSGAQLVSGGVELEGTALSPTSTASTLEQTIATVPGAVYQISLSMYAMNGGANSESVGIYADGVLIGTLTSDVAYADRFTAEASSLSVSFYAAGTSTRISLRALPSSSGNPFPQPGDGTGEVLTQASVRQLDPDTDGDGVLDRLDLDSDNDGITDNVEAQTSAGYKAPSGQGVAMTDADRDGLDDRYDANTADATAAASVGLIPVNVYGGSTADYVDDDTDGDGVLDIAERGDGQPTSITSTADTDGDSLLDIFEHNTLLDGCR